jgi:hypothetical protein
MQEAKCPQCKEMGVKSFLHDSKTANNMLGQITAYAAVQLSAQLWTHVYSVFIRKGLARILRWDRSGTIMMEAIKYAESPLLTEFFRCYSCASPEMRGKDTSTSLHFTSAEEAAARTALGVDENNPLIRIVVPNEGSSHYFLTTHPPASAYTPLEHATCVFRAYDVMR